MESSNQNIEKFDVGNQALSVNKLYSSVWRYLNKLQDASEGAFHQERDTLSSEIDHLTDVLNSFARRIGLLSFYMDKVMMRIVQQQKESSQIEVLRLRLDELMNDFRIKVEDPVEKTIEGLLLDYCEVVENVPKPSLKEHIVGETLTPLIWFNDQLIHRAEVIGWTGIPADGEQLPTLD